jgi:putative hydrolase of HD superfamily
MFLADQLVANGISVNVERVLRMSLLHDWAEVRVGDMPRTATEYFGAEVRKQAEMSAFSDLVNEIGQSQTLYTDLYEDYEQRRSLEARVVKAADVIDLLVEALALEQAGARGLDEFWEVATSPAFQLDGVALQIVDDVLQSLLQARREIA